MREEFGNQDCAFPRVKEHLPLLKEGLDVVNQGLHRGHILAEQHQVVSISQRREFEIANRQTSRTGVNILQQLINDHVKEYWG